MQTQTTQTTSRKRSAPGAVPASMMPRQNDRTASSINDLSNFSDIPELPPDLLNWSDSRVQEVNGDPANAFGSDAFAPDGSSGQLVRRNQNNQMQRTAFDPSGQVAWQDMVPQAPPAWQQSLLEDDDELDRRATEAMEDATSRRPPKAIPPFIQKLSSFLDNPNYSHLIRWTTDGKSFVVLDEDEFAKQLIPELFKHNNYASFVRQLNMYGFHKKVGLSDNSMRASEKKAKSPSEYSNPFFRRGRPNLLWLISKPKGEPAKSKSKKSKPGDTDHPDTRSGSQLVEQSIGSSQRNTQDLVSVPKEQWAQYRREISELRRNQQQINSLIARFQHENARFIQQASAQHERHENSINAILTFLATFYSRSVDGNGNFANMFNNSIPNGTTQGNVAEMDDSYNASEGSSQQLVRSRRPLLLPAPIESRTSESPANDSRQSPALSRPASNLSSRPKAPSTAVNAGADNDLSPRIKEQSTTPDMFKRNHHSRSQSAAPSTSDMMAAIHNANTNTDENNSAFDFNSALRHFESANGNAPLTPEQRSNMLSLMTNSADSGNNNALSMLRQSDPSADMFSQFQSNNEQLEQLTKMQRDQDARMQNLADKIQPLSPGGVIPGYSSTGNSPAPSLGYGNDSGDFDFNKYINADNLDNYFGDLGNTTDNGEGTTDDFKDFGFADDGEHENGDDYDDGMFADESKDSRSLHPSEAGRIIGSANGSGAPSPSVEDDVEEIPRKRKRTNGA